MKIIVFGLGSIGLRHARILKERFACEVVAFRSQGHKGNALNLREVDQWSQLEGESFDAAWITNPTHKHVEVALECARRGIHLFIEKPLSDRWEGIPQLEQICKEKKLACYVAYPLRFHPVILKVQDLLKGKRIIHVQIRCSSFLPSWRNQDIKENYSAYRHQGGGVLLDLSHELDYTEYLFGPVSHFSGLKGKNSTITVDSEDFADIVCETTKDKIPLNIHLDYFSRLPERIFKITLEGGSIEGNLLDSSVTFNNAGKTEVFQLPCDRDDFLYEQTKYFLGTLTNPMQSMNHISEAKQLLAKIIEFRND